MSTAKIVGVIGETGSGKSTFSNYIQKNYAAYVINADQIGHLVLDENQIKEALVKKFSENILVDSRINRKRLGSIVFNDASALEFLSQLTHPRIRERIIEEIQEKKNTYSLILIDGVALVEANIHTLCDLVIYIFTSREIRLKRLVEQRNIPYERAVAMMASQKETDFYDHYSDVTLSLNHGIEHKEQEIKHLLQEIL
jgi:dephospho-CoA kinase